MTTLFPEGVNAVGVVAICAFFVCLLAGALAFVPFAQHLKTADPKSPLSVWKKPEVRRSFARFAAVWIAAMVCIAVAITVGGWPVNGA